VIDWPSEDMVEVSLDRLRSLVEGEAGGLAGPDGARTPGMGVLVERQPIFAGFWLAANHRGCCVLGRTHSLSYAISLRPCWWTLH